MKRLEGPCRDVAVFNVYRQETYPNGSWLQDVHRPTSSVQAIASSGEYEPEMMQLCTTFMTPTASCIDIGANVGFFTCFFATRLAASVGGLVHAFEPIEPNYNRLVSNIELNGAESFVKAYRLALADRIGRIVFHVKPEGKTNNAVSDAIGGA